MQVLDTTHYLSNADVLNWAKSKRKQHALEDTEARSSGHTPTPRPKNFLDVLEKTERHLASRSYPHAKNPSAYDGENADDSNQKFSDAFMKKLHVPLAKTYQEKIDKKELTVKEAQDQLGDDQEKKDFSEMELLMIHNHAPMCVEMLQPMLENWEERFTMEELEIVVECIKEVFRVDELKVTDAEVDDLAEQFSNADPFDARAEKTTGAVVDYDEPLSDPLPLVGPRLAFRPAPEMKEPSGPNSAPLGRPNRLE